MSSRRPDPRKLAATPPLSKPEADLARLKKMLRRVIGNDEAAIQRVFEAGGADALRILDIACGDCREADTLGETFSELKAEHTGPEATPLDIQLTGIDVRAREIADAQRRFGGKREDKKTGGKREAEFLVGDASKLDQHKQLGDGENFDVVFMRHQNYWNGDRTWEEIFDQALHKLDDEGRLVITSYFDDEHQLALDAIQKLGGKLIVTERNEESRELSTPGKSIDRHVAVFRKKD
ncbi:MAG: class I SAM-dependent methyltransferase [Verrucomicrobiae bacterium]|nr:class I SAM-dependent methyltransferase [Verrucomicrobiae bacterium]